MKMSGNFFCHNIYSDFLNHSITVELRNIIFDRLHISQAFMSAVFNKIYINHYSLYEL